MTERESFKNTPSRDQVVEVFRKLHDKDITDPWDRNNDEQTNEAWALYDSFFNNLNSNHKDVPASLRANQQASIDLIMIEAGYIDQDSIGEVLDFLEQDLESAKEIGDTELIEQIQSKITELEKLSTQFQEE